jgi:hypothetical protein
MNDKLGYSPLVKKEDSCYIVPINEKYNQYNCLVSGFQTNDLMKESEGFDFEKYEETMPELHKDIKQIDEEGRVWYAQTINVEDKGIVFAGGTSKDDWGFIGIKHILVPEEEKEKFKRPDGSYIKYKNDPKTMKKFTKFEFIDALDYVGLLD